MSYITEGSLSDSVLFKSFNSASKLSTTLIDAIKHSTEITSDFIEEQLLQLRRSRISPLLEKVLNAYNTGSIVLLYANNNIKVPQAIPFFAMKTYNGGTKVFVFVNNFGSLTQSKTDSNRSYLNIAMKDLYSLMEGAFIALTYGTKKTNFKRALGLQRLTTKIYSQMMTMILNKEYALSMDQDLTAEITFIISYFFMKYVWESDNEMINTSYALDSLTQNGKFSLTSTNKADLIVNEMNSKVTDVSSLISFLESRSNRLKGLGFRYFVQGYINTYKAPAIFSMECLPYFLFVISTASLGSFIVNTPVVNNITSSIKGMNQYYNELSRLVV